MANKNAVWGIDIGQSALKALRCTLEADGETVVADKYDFVEFPKILSSADADPEEMIQEALQQFLSRNSVLGDKVAISVSGQAGLSRFFKPPPVEVKTLPDIVKFEVKQQIPFPIEDVIWDWQQLGGTVVDGRTVDAEVGLFAMKREAVYRALHPFDEADVEVDLVQLSPLAVFNVVCHDIIGELPDPEDFDPENPPPSIVVMSMGTDTTDLIVTNGLKLWLRNIPIGGNHFTKQLSREMRLTQAKAEHLKKNARVSENPKAIFKAMRPVFNDFVNEVQRSLTFFESMEKSAELSKIVLLGNAAKLPGLRQYLSKQLEMDIAKVTEFDKLSGTEVLAQKTFSDNLLSFAPCYGLCLQGLQKAQIKTNLLPDEIVVERIIRAKKPWILTAVCAAMLGLTLGYYFTTTAWYRTTPEFTDASDVNWKKAFTEVKAKQTASQKFIETDLAQKSLLDQFNRLSRELTSASEQKSAWLELQAAVAQAFPRDPRIQELKVAGIQKVDPAKIPFEDREELYIDHLESVYFPDIKVWKDAIQPFHDKMKIDFTEEVKKVRSGKPKAEAEAEVVDTARDEEMQRLLKMDYGAIRQESEVAAKVDLSNSGWVIEIKGHHFHNSDKAIEQLRSGKMYLMETLINELLRKQDVTIAAHPGINFSYQDIGISAPTITYSSTPERKDIVFDPTSADGGLATPGGSGGGKFAGGMGGMGASGPGESAGDTARGGTGQSAEEKKANSYPVREYTFVVQMAWKPRTDAEILEARELRIAEEAAAAKAAEEGTADAGDAAVDTAAGDQ